MILDALEVSIVLLSVPVVAADVHCSLWTAQWLMSGFALGFAAVLVPGPSLAARWGRRRVYLVALAVFVVASLIGGFTSSIGVLILARVVKGGCAALTAPAGLAVIGTTFPDGPEQRRAVAVYSMFGAAGFTVGLLLSGVLLFVDWHWVFVLPAVVAMALLVASWQILPDDRPLARATAKSATSLLREGSFLRSAVGAATLNGAYASVLLLISVRLHEMAGWASWEIALGLLPACVPLAASVPFSSGLIGRFGTARLILAGAACALIGEVLLFAGPNSYFSGFLPVLVLIETGFVLSFAALNVQAVSALPAASRSAAVPVYQMAVQLGAVVLLPVVTALNGLRVPIVAVAVAGILGLLAAATNNSMSKQRSPS